MIIHQIHDLTNEPVIALMSEVLSKITDTNVIANYHPDYADVPGNLFYVLAQGRYREGYGKYYVIEEDGKYVCSAGWNEYELDTDIALMITRMFVNPEFRSQYYIGTHILPLALEEVKDYKFIWATCNEYNSVMVRWLERIAKNKSTQFYWPEIYKRFNLIGKRTIYYTEQYVVEFAKE